LAVLQLRSHIPIAAPARREPADGSESRMRVVPGFEPGWFHCRCGIDFSEHWHRDPVYRYETLAVMQAELCRAFPEVHHWKAGAVEDLATISGCHGAYVVPCVFGLPLRYAPDRWPELDPARKLSAVEIESLDPGRLLGGPFVEGLLGQMDVIQRRWGRIHGYLNWQGVLNNAFHLRGQEIFLDMHDRPALAHHLFSTVTEVMIRLAGMVQERQRQSGFAVNQFCVSNCTVNMVSPRLYREFLSPYDKTIARSFERFGVHTCNWNVTPYLGVLRELPNMGYLDMGMESDMSKAREMFPETRRAVMYSPVKLKEAFLEEIAADMERVYGQLSPCDVVMADIQDGTPDERFRDLLRICRRLEAQHAGPL